MGGSESFRKAMKYYDTGFMRRPMSNMEPESLCRITNRKGWSALNIHCDFVTHLSTDSTVTAPASVPSSFTLTNVFCTTLETNNGSAVTPERPVGFTRNKHLFSPHF